MNWLDIIEGALRTAVWLMIGYGLYRGVRAWFASASETHDATEE